MNVRGETAAKAEHARDLGPCSCLRAWIRLRLLSLACAKALTCTNLQMCACVPCSPVPGGLHCHTLVVSPSNHVGAYSQLGPLQVPVHTQSALALAACPGPHHSMCVCSYPLLLQAPTSPHSCLCALNHHCSCWSIAAGSGDTAEDSNSPCSLCGLPVSLVRAGDWSGLKRNESPWLPVTSATKRSSLPLMYKKCWKEFFKQKWKDVN